MATVSFRDPSGHVINVCGRTFRVVNKSGLQDYEEFHLSKTAKEFLATHRLISAEQLNGEIKSNLPNAVRQLLSSQDNSGSVVLEHERVSFPGYPYEWSPAMLYAAGELTLDLAERTLEDEFGLKDATPYNILFCGTQPVFVDWLSFEKRDVHNPVWLPQAQFTRNFLLPLLVNKVFGLRLDGLFTSRRDGLEPEEVYKLCSVKQKFSKPFLSLVSAPTWLNAGQKNKHADKSLYQSKKLHDPEKALFILRRQFKTLRKQLKAVAPENDKRSAWTEYMGEDRHFADDYLKEKETFIKEALAEFRPQKVLDIGCNTGHFSRCAAQTGASVVAIDQDETVIDSVWRNAFEQTLDVLPLVVDIARPTSAIGWRNGECSSFLERAQGYFDAVLMLALVHHLLVTERIPLMEIFDLAAELTKDLLIAEFVPKDDRMFQSLLRGRESLFENFSREVFETAATLRFEKVRSVRLGSSNRWLYLFRKRK